ncbi:hypothetical protein MA16_Dca008544 [Dendrobium catenatum]|uniref:Uncharacterized protein n=1 Tax=Dendrobium catenatum TaxID=906689 RepID=A0A2I0XHR4_9ASPA|nr:hypothetical protein MA16_Dca008544 [Dendrobium catenatum]
MLWETFLQEPVNLKFSRDRIKGFTNAKLSTEDFNATSSAESENFFSQQNVIRRDSGFNKSSLIDVHSEGHGVSKSSGKNLSNASIKNITQSNRSKVGNRRSVLLRNTK